MNKILVPYSKRGLSLKNHLVMAPMTRSRAIGNVPNELMALYYGQRNGAGLIVTEGTAPSPEGSGYGRIPGIYNDAQVQGWKPVTAAAHAGGSKIFMQLMHTGRVGHKDNLPEGETIYSASAIKMAGQIHTDKGGMQDYQEPLAFTTEGVHEVVAIHVKAAQNAIEAGFDGIELHGANGYLIEQFLNPNVNTRTDQYGGSIENRSRIVLEMAAGIAAAIGAEKVGIRFSPYNQLGDMAPYDDAEVHATYSYLATELDKIGIAYIHVGVNPQVPQKMLDAIRTAFDGTIILCNGLTPETAEAALGAGFADLIAFGRNFISNPDLDKRIAVNAPLNQPDFTTLFTPGEKGYTDYPFMN